MRNPQEFAVVVERVQQRLHAAVDIIKTFAVLELVSAQVASPGRHFFARNFREFLAFPGAEVHLDDFFALLHGKSCRLFCLFGESQTTQEGARKHPCGFCASAQQRFQCPVAFFFKSGGYIKVEPAVADVVRVVGLGVANGPKNHAAVS